MRSVDLALLGVKHEEYIIVATNQFGLFETMGRTVCPDDLQNGDMVNVALIMATPCMPQPELDRTLPGHANERWVRMYQGTVSHIGEIATLLHVIDLKLVDSEAKATPKPTSGELWLDRLCDSIFIDIIRALPDNQLAFDVTPI